MKRVLVLGGQGMLGHIVVKTLSGLQEIKVECTVKGDGDSPFYFNVENGIDQLHKIIKSHGDFDYIINCIGILSNNIDERNSDSVRTAILVNGMFPHDLIKLGSELGIRIIHISTDGVFSRSAGLCFEDSLQFCEDIYGKTKSLGEGFAPELLNIRCSIIGPSPFKRNGLIEWFLKQPEGSEINGYTDHVWSGATTLQLANLCYFVIAKDYFNLIRNEAPVHHFCPNQAISKFELLQLFKTKLRPDIEVIPVNSPDGPLSRILETRYIQIKKLYGNKEKLCRALKVLMNN